MDMDIKYGEKEEGDELSTFFGAKPTLLLQSPR